jgi:hypothetical protein
MPPEPSLITAVEFISSHSRQGVNVTLTGGTKVSDLSLATVKVVRLRKQPSSSMPSPIRHRKSWLELLMVTNVLTSASVIDMKTNDPTTIPAKQ